MNKKQVFVFLKSLPKTCDPRLVNKTIKFYFRKVDCLCLVVFVRIITIRISYGPKYKQFDRNELTFAVPQKPSWPLC